MNTAAYVLALYEYMGENHHVCRVVDVFSEREPTTLLRGGFYWVELLSCKGLSFEDAHAAALVQLEHNPSLVWALEFLASRSRSKEKDT